MTYTGIFAAIFAVTFLFLMALSHGNGGPLRDRLLMGFALAAIVAFLDVAAVAGFVFLSDWLMRVVC